jgi:hypothetical protein
MDVWVSLPVDLGRRLNSVTEQMGWSQALLIRAALGDFLDALEWVEPASPGAPCPAGPSAPPGRAVSSRVQGRCRPGPSVRAPLGPIPG